VQFGARNVLTDFQPAEVLRLIESEHVTIANLVPTMAAMLLAESTVKTRDLSSLRGLVFAGAMFPEPLRLRVAAELCSNVYEYYGMQETGTLTISTPEDEDSTPGPLGRRSPSQRSISNGRTARSRRQERSARSSAAPRLRAPTISTIPRKPPRPSEAASSTPATSA
jgi:acyl-CoA synthetase (AMP-forming)/AMP-acid ligase II